MAVGFSQQPSRVAPELSSGRVCLLAVPALKRACQRYYDIVWELRMANESLRIYCSRWGIVHSGGWYNQSWPGE